MEIRRLRVGEGPELAALVAESFAEELALSGLSAGGVSSQIQAAALASRPPSTQLLRMAGIIAELWVAVEHERPIGCYGIFGRSQLTISTVAVRPECRGRGVGRALMEHALERARRLGRREVLLEVLADNEAAVHLYRSLGMQEYDRRLTYTKRLNHSDLLATSRPRIAAIPVSSAALDRWKEVLEASIPTEALRFAGRYRSEYLSNPFSRRLGDRLGPRCTIRRAVALDGRVVGFLVARYSHRRPMAEIMTPLYLPEAVPFLPDILQIATGEAAKGNRALCRLYLSEHHPEAWPVAEGLGYEFERSWLYLYREV